jgi:SPP1 gp7 family putative phage head morphogenesis protein
MLKQIHKRFRNIVFDGMNKEFVKEQIYDEDVLVRLKRLLKDFNLKIDNQFNMNRLVEFATRSVNAVYMYNEVNWAGRLKGFGIELNKDYSYRFLKKFLELSIESNVSIIKNLKVDVANKLEETIYRNFEAGKTFTELSKELVERFGIDKRRAIKIARNEIKNTYTQLNKKRMVEYGVDKATWDTSGDERVRSSHKKFEGKEYIVGKGLWNEDIKKYVEPGDEINCRCIAIPII